MSWKVLSRSMSTMLPEIAAPTPMPRLSSANCSPNTFCRSALPVTEVRIVFCPAQIELLANAPSVSTPQNCHALPASASPPIAVASITSAGSTTRRAPNRSMSAPPTGAANRLSRPNQPISRPAVLSPMWWTFVR
jgi:hypothetical protein